MSEDQPAEPRFFADVMLGRLARWLRILGYDVLYERGIDDDELLLRAESEGRIILTRDTALMQRNTSATLEFMASEKPEEQLRFMRSKYGITLDRDKLFTRCSWCNEMMQKISRNEIQGWVPPYVFETEKHFLRCPKCQKIYWHGTHGDRFIEQLFGVNS